MTELVRSSAKPTAPPSKSPDLLKPNNAPKGISTEEIHQAFVLAALHSGNMVKATEVINKEREHEGLEPVAVDTLRGYRRRNRALYEKTAREVQERVRHDQAEKYMAAAADARDAGEEIRELLLKNLHEIPPRDLPGALRNAATTSGIYTDKALALTGDSPTGVKVNISFGETAQALARQGVRFYDSSSGGRELNLDEVVDSTGENFGADAEANDRTG